MYFHFQKGMSVVKTSLGWGREYYHKMVNFANRLGLLPSSYAFIFIKIEGIWIFTEGHLHPSFNPLYQTGK